MSCSDPSPMGGRGAGRREPGRFGRQRVRSASYVGRRRFAEGGCRSTHASMLHHNKLDADPPGSARFNRRQ
jgi:hypothetical protein